MPSDAPETQRSKADCRLEMRRRMKMLPESERQTASAQVCQRLRQAGFWEKSRFVLGYAALSEELDIWPVLIVALQQEKRLALPRHDADTDLYEAREIRDPAADTEAGFYGIREPKPRCARISLKPLDLALVPGLGFNSAGFRLGRGRGYYDRFLADFAGIKCGVAFDWQVDLPFAGQPHDIRMDCLITPTQARFITGAGAVCE